MSHNHAVVWLDHREARVIDFSVDAVHKATVRSHAADRQIHHRSGSVSGTHAPDDLRFFDDICAAIGDAKEVLVVGPGQAKLGFRHHLDDRHKDLARRVVGVETLDHPGDGELLAHARKYFVKVDRMLGDQGQA